jgi:predicted TPR repeat methyltransferase
MIKDLFKHALALHQSGETQQAEEGYKQLLKKDPRNADAHHLLGILLGQQGRFEEALHPLHTALALEPDSPSFHNSMGNVEKHLGNIEQAIFHYEQALKSPLASSAVHNNLGTLFQQKKQWDKAGECYKKAIQLRPDYADAHYNLSTVLTEQGNYSGAIDHLMLTLKHQTEHAQAHTHLAQLLLQQQRPEEAIAHCEQRLKIDPDHIETHHQLAVAFTQQNRWEEAISHYQRTLTLKPDHEEALHNLGALYVVQRKPELALPCYLKQLAFHPDFDTYYNIGVIYLYQDRHEDAIQYLNEALRLEPNSFNTHVNLGAVYLKKEALAEAITHYETALALKPGDAELLYILAALSGSSTQSSPTTAPKAYIENLFDQYAPYFDKHLTTYLHYRVPALLLKALQEEMGGTLSFDKVLDLGCGTGLCGQAFRPYTKEMIGIDLSDNMLAVARDKQIYDMVQNSDIHDALQQYHHLDLIIAGDVFGYVGDLEQTFFLLTQALKETGIFVFTTEKTYEADFQLQNNARFAHHKSYIERLAHTHHFEVLRCENAVLRMQKEQTVEGFVWVLRQSRRIPVH